jgi:protein SCO1/2
MRTDGAEWAITEPQFAALVDELAAAGDRRSELEALLRENHPAYAQHGTAATVRMRGWLLLTLARAELSDAALVFVLEELETAVDAYLVAAAARALRSYPRPHPAFGSRVVRAMINIRPHDEPVSFEAYGEYATSSTATTPLRELIAALAWLGPHAGGVLGDLEAVRCDLPKKLHADLSRAVGIIRGTEAVELSDETRCCALPRNLRHAVARAFSSPRTAEPIENVTFQDHDGATLTFGEFFRGNPAIVLFFYTRCDNPLKCSLSIAKLARIQELLRERGLSGAIRTAAITYDPGFDTPARIRGYAASRGVQMDETNRMLRSRDGFDELRRHFELNVNFVGSLVNRHSIEVYLLDAAGRIAFSFERLHWGETEVVDRAAELLEATTDAPSLKSVGSSETRLPGIDMASPFVGTLSAMGLALFPKCPLCWTGYLGLFGVASLEQMPYAPWLQFPILALLLVVLASLWWRGRATGRMSPFLIAAAGAVLIASAKLSAGNSNLALAGAALVFVGSLLGAAKMVSRTRPASLPAGRAA